MALLLRFNSSLHGIHVHCLKFVCFHIKIFQRKMHSDDLSTNIHLCFCTVCVRASDCLISLYCNDPYLHNIQHTDARDVRNKFENSKERKNACERKTESESEATLFIKVKVTSVCVSYTMK